jgi:hypothetical protein
MKTQPYFSFLKEGKGGLKTVEPEYRIFPFNWYKFNELTNETFFGDGRKKFTYYEIVVENIILTFFRNFNSLFHFFPND